MIDEREFLERARLDRATLEVWIRAEWIFPARTTPDRTFTEIDLARAKLIRELKHNMGVNDAGLDVILHLLDQMHGLRTALAEALASMRDREKGSGV